MSIFDKITPVTKEDFKGTQEKLDALLRGQVKIMGIVEDVKTATDKVSAALDDIASDIQKLKDLLANTPLPPDAQAALDGLVAKAEALAAENS